MLTFVLSAVHILGSLLQLLLAERLRLNALIFRLQLIKISAAVMGIEFSYAAETAFVSPTLLKIGNTTFVSILS